VKGIIQSALKRNPGIADDLVFKRAAGDYPFRFKKLGGRLENVFQHFYGFPSQESAAKFTSRKGAFIENQNPVAM
jgi:hypothetical protein